MKLCHCVLIILLGLTNAHKDACVLSNPETVSTLSNDVDNCKSQALVKPDDPDHKSINGTIRKPLFKDKIIISSQQAIEQLLNRWTDLSLWTPPTDTSSICERDAQRAIESYHSNELWALRIFDSWARPGPSIYVGRSAFTGNYYQCREAVDDAIVKTTGFRGNYCVVTLANLTKGENIVTTRLIHLCLPDVHLGVCLPDTCLQEEVTKLFQERLEKLNATHFLQSIKTDCQNDEREYTTFTVIALLLLAVMGTLTVFGTIIDVALIYLPSTTLSQQDKDKKENLDKSEIGKKSGQDRATQGLWVKVLLSFSAYTNGKRLLSSSQAAGSIDVIPGLRFINMSWIIGGHTFFLLINGHSNNISEGINRISQYRIFDLFLTLHFGVDSFFTISGFLVSYLTIKRVIEQGFNFRWGHFFFHRYWRLTPTFMVSFVLIQGLQRFMVSGMVAPTVQPNDKLACEKNWWVFPLYLNNIFNVDFGNMCFGHAWSLAADFQLYLLSPLMMIPFYYNKVVGLLNCLFFTIGHWIIAGILSYQYKGHIGKLWFPIDWFKHGYYSFYSRIGPFTVGILCGYILSVNNGRVNMSPRTVVIGWVLATTTIIVLIFGFHGDITGESPTSLFVTTIYNAVSRTAWGAIICWIIIACSSGYGGPIKALLSWPPFIVLGRLTYIGYLIHLSVSTIIFENLEQLVVLNLMSLITFWTVNLVFTCLVSAVLLICTELPLLHLEKVLFANK